MAKKKDDEQGAGDPEAGQDVMALLAPVKSELGQVEQEIRQAIELIGRGEASTADRVLHTTLTRLTQINEVVNAA